MYQALVCSFPAVSHVVEGVILKGGGKEDKYDWEALCIF